MALKRDTCIFPFRLHDNHSFKSCGTCILVVSKVSLCNKIVLPVQISTNNSITRCNSVIRVGNSGRGLRVRNATQRIQTVSACQHLRQLNINEISEPYPAYMCFIVVIREVNS